MKVWIISDLHLETRAMSLPLPEADVCIAAGDVAGSVVGSMIWLHERVGRWMPVVYVPGNHEFYGEDRSAALRQARALDDRGWLDGVHLLDDRQVVIGGTRFIGATLWTDYALDAAPAPAPARDRDLAYAQRRAADLIADHQRIAGWQPKDAVAAHRVSRSFIEGELAEPFDGPTVVVTHHAPHALSLSREFARTGLDGAYASDLLSTIECGRPELWVHGHVHEARDYRVGDTRVVANPRGFVGEDTGWDPGLVIEIESRPRGGSHAVG